MLFTSFYDSEKLDKAIDNGEYVVSISRSEPKWLEFDEKVWELAPGRELFLNSKKGMSDEDFEREYFKQLDVQKDKILQILARLEKKNAILCCWCEDYSYCHRFFLTKWAKKHNIVIKEI